MGVTKVGTVSPTVSEVTNRPASHFYREWMWVPVWLRFCGVILVCSVALQLRRGHVSDNGNVGYGSFNHRDPSIQYSCEEADQRNHVWQPFSSNEYFFSSGRSSKTCPDMNMDYHHRIAASTDLKSMDTMTEIEIMDPLLMNFTKPDNLTSGLVFLKNYMTGPWRAVSGASVPSGDAGKFDPHYGEGYPIWYEPASHSGSPIPRSSACSLFFLAVDSAIHKSWTEPRTHVGFILGNVTSAYTTAFVKNHSARSCCGDCNQLPAPALPVILPPLSHKKSVAIACAFGAAVLGGVLSLLVILYCRDQRKLRDQDEAFLRSIEFPIPDVPIVEPVQVAIEMATIR